MLFKKAVRVKLISLFLCNDVPMCQCADVPIEVEDPV